MERGIYKLSGFRAESLQPGSKMKTRREGIPTLQMIWKTDQLADIMSAENDARQMTNLFFAGKFLICYHCLSQWEPLTGKALQ